MDLYETTVATLPPAWKSRITVVDNAAALHQRIAVEFADALAAATEADRILTVICPVGPLDYRVVVRELARRGLHCRNLRTVNMDEYLGADEQLIPRTHPLSFRRFMEETFFGLLPAAERPRPENILFPDPDRPEAITALLDEIGGADLCWAGFGITGHIAFNDPPAMLAEPTDMASFRDCQTRKVTIAPMSLAQMAMGGTHGNVDIIPRRAVTVGLHELLQVKRLHLTFMRSWHAGLWRRGLLGPVTPEFPGSLTQEHPNMAVTMTAAAARPPLLNTAQDTGEEG